MESQLERRLSALISAMKKSNTTLCCIKDALETGGFNGVPHFTGCIRRDNGVPESCVMSFINPILTPRLISVERTSSTTPTRHNIEFKTTVGGYTSLLSELTTSSNIYSRGILTTPSAGQYEFHGGQINNIQGNGVDTITFELETNSKFASRASDLCSYVYHNQEDYTADNISLNNYINTYLTIGVPLVGGSTMWSGLIVDVVNYTPAEPSYEYIPAKQVLTYNAQTNDLTETYYTPGDINSTINFDSSTDIFTTDCGGEIEERIIEYEVDGICYLQKCKASSCNCYDKVTGQEIQCPDFAPFKILTFDVGDDISQIVSITSCGNSKTQIEFINPENLTLNNTNLGSAILTEGISGVVNAVYTIGTKTLEVTVNSSCNFSFVTTNSSYLSPTSITLVEGDVLYKECGCSTCTDCIPDDTLLQIGNIMDWTSAVDFTNTANGTATPYASLHRLDSIGINFPTSIVDASNFPLGIGNELVHGWNIKVPSCIKGVFTVQLRFSFTGLSDSDALDYDFSLALGDQDLVPITPTNVFNSVIAGNVILGSWTPLATQQTIGAQYVFPSGTTEINLAGIFQANPSGSPTDQFQFDDISIVFVDADYSGCDKGGEATRTIGCLDKKILQSIDAITPTGTLKQGKIQLTGGVSPVTWSPSFEMKSYSILINTVTTGPTFKDSFGNTTTLVANEVLKYATERDRPLDNSPILTINNGDIATVTWTSV